MLGLLTVSRMAGHATQRWQMSYVSFSWRPQAWQWINTWNVSRRCWMLRSLMTASRRTCRRQFLSSQKFCAVIHDRRIRAIVSVCSLGPFFWSAAFKHGCCSYPCGIWVKETSEASTMHRRAPGVCTSRVVEMYNLMLSTLNWHTLWTPGRHVAVFFLGCRGGGGCIEYQVL